MSKHNKVEAAAVEGKLKKVKKLLDAGNKMPGNILQTVIFSGWAQGANVNMVRLLIDAGADVNSTADNTPLYAAAMVGPFPSRSLAATELLLERGADPNLTCGAESPLHLAVTTVAHETVGALLEAGANVNAVDRHGESVVHSCVKALYDFVEEFNSSDESAREEAFEDAGAVVMNNLSQVLASGPDLTLTDAIGNTALASVFFKATYPEAILTALLTAGSSPHDRVIVSDKERINLATAAVVRNLSPAILRTLLTAGVNINEPCEVFGGASGLVYACTLRPQLAKVIFDVKPELISVITPGTQSNMLHCAASGGSCELITYLLQAGVSPTAKSNKGLTPYDVAVSTEHSEAAALLKQP